MQNEEPRTKRTAAGIESRNVPMFPLCIYMCVYSHLLRIRISTPSLLLSSETQGFYEFSGPKFATARCPRTRRIGNGCILLRDDDSKNLIARYVGGFMAAMIVNKLSLRIRGVELLAYLVKYSPTFNYARPR